MQIFQFPKLVKDSCNGEMGSWGPNVGPIKMAEVWKVEELGKGKERIPKNSMELEMDEHLLNVSQRAANRRSKIGYWDLGASCSIGIFRSPHHI